METNDNYKKNDFFKTQGEVYRKVNDSIKGTWPTWKQEACKQNFAVKLK